ncbi:MAG: DMT family transporter [Eubacteriaceae bacterium]|uniref:DMT family transporter n=1 Tax=Candidatus Pseudoramibacter fermentans TaxID=2594427 RepID=A0A6L5GT89_9FIRM|nr:DMT family transporter [Candidatus Pseudoramibacter fermentans]RRF93291.1 MAG: DMT family transporter [Eubacteriaceae bacterium]
MSKLTQKHPHLLPQLALFAAAIIWGSSFFLMKRVVAVFPTFYLLALRFTIATALLSLIFRKRVAKLKPADLKAGFVIAATFCLAYAFQTIGLKGTTPAKNSFLSATYCVFVPFLSWAIEKIRPDRANIVAVFLCIVGVGLVSLTRQFTVSWGDGLTLICGLFFALNIIASAHYSQTIDVTLITIMQFAFAAVFCWICAFFTETWPAHIPASCLGELIYLALFASGLAYLCQNFGLKHENTTSASIILCLEAVFGVLFSVLFYGERLTPRLLTGFAVIFISVLISELKPQWLNKKRSAE